MRRNAGNLARSLVDFPGRPLRRSCPTAGVNDSGRRFVQAAERVDGRVGRVASAAVPRREPAGRARRRPVPVLRTAAGGTGRPGPGGNRLGDRRGRVWPGLPPGGGCLGPPAPRRMRPAVCAVLLRVSAPTVPIVRACGRSNVPQCGTARCRVKCEPVASAWVKWRRWHRAPRGASGSHHRLPGRLRSRRAPPSGRRPALGRPCARAPGAPRGSTAQPTTPRRPRG